ncbi:phosphomevalonate kinase [Nocardia amikacinitolerans]|uniref:phosphomevalonate kinase n=1 Tax=Nocardia amikacinitolerans TaxID=756689 RepID=UPI0020A2BFE7|nr:phosphomevalonate kinase [Nocardia amikacinitolerans]MCP2279302.1 phosphomevalonate kinase [Nocardia amikacinitolerans]
MITCRAPGKLFIAGEYAVVEPGRHAVLTAVDRYATATVVEAEDQVTTLHSGLDGGVTLTCGRIGDGLVPADGVVPPNFSYVFAAAAIIDRLVVERDIVARPYRLSISTDLADADGRKLGLGSSAAVTVATVAALGQFYRLGLSSMGRYRLAMLATVSINPRASGGDVAASTWGGWIAYSSPDRGHVAELVAESGVAAALRAPWPGLSVRPLPTPTGLAMRVGWTEKPASTPALVAGLRAGAPADFLVHSDECVQRLVAALEADDAPAIRTEIDRARALLVDLDARARLGIMTPSLRALCEAGAAVGAAAKPSGAGGGDCGIALIDRARTAAITELTDRWVGAGIRPLALRTHPFEGDRR